MREHWGSRLGFVLAVAGSAIGLGNIWRFPYVCGMNGGGAFVLIYLVCVLVVGFPLMLAELTLGRATQSSTVGAFRTLTPARTTFSDMLGSLLVISGASLLFIKAFGYGFILSISGIVFLLFGWRLVGFICGMLVPILITAYYSVIGGWTLIYMGKAFSGNLNFSDPASADALMTPIVTAAPGMKAVVISCSILFMFLCTAILFSGVKKGIERWSKVLMPLLFSLLMILIVRGISLPGAGKGLLFFLYPDFSKLSVDSVIAAMGHAFFSLSIGMGIVLTYGSYLSQKENIVKSTFTVIALDTLSALMAGMAIFPAVFAMGFKETSGPVLIYQILPAAFNQIPGNISWLWNGLFFMMISVAALTSGISLLEPPVRICVDEFKWSRKVSLIVISLICTLLGVICSLSMNDWSHYPVLERIMKWLWPSGAPASLFTALDNFSCNWMLPLTGLLIAFYVGWVWGVKHAVKEFRRGSSNKIFANLWLLMADLQKNGKSKNDISLFSLAVLWGFFIRLLSPVAVLIAFLNGIGAIDF